ncbi:hypothetical protein FGO68_gene11097 [Halteria grandinella]|uniref:N-acetyltransferase domain-containing protein n=1 Tax=Halteria grandinella TaxID=5974 RepID=A0A8J8NKU6_HALGN|nr:hypothetical protein FGO68_gene11097 [Halteria grandinella]
MEQPTDRKVCAVEDKERALSDESHSTQASILTHKKSHSIICEQIKKTKKNEPRIFPFLLMVDKEAFPIDQWGMEGQRTATILKQFWRSPTDKIAVARKEDTNCNKAIVGYACYIEGIGGGESGSSPNACYLMRIGVRTKCQRQGIGRKLMAFLLEKYSKGVMSLDVNAENEKAIRFYRGLGLTECETYRVMDKQAFIKFQTPWAGFRLREREVGKGEEVEKGGKQTI